MWKTDDFGCPSGGVLAQKGTWGENPPPLQILKTTFLNPLAGFDFLGFFKKSQPWPLAKAHPKPKPKAKAKAKPKAKAKAKTKGILFLSTNCFQAIVYSFSTL